MKLPFGLLGSLKGMLIAASLIGSLVPVGMLAAGSALEIRSQVVQRNMAQNRLLAESFAEGLEAFLAAHVRLVEIVADDVAALERLDRATVEPVLGRRFARLSPITRLVFADARGIGIASLPSTGAEPAVVGFDYSDREYLKEARQTKKAVIDPAILIGRTDRIPVIAIAAPVLDQGGGLRGILIAGTNVARLRELVERYERGIEVDIQVAARDGTIFAHRNPALVIEQRNFAKDPIWPLVSAASSGTIPSYRGVDGTMRLAGFATVPSTGWKVWVGQPLAAIDADLRAAYYTNAEWVATAVIAAVALSALIAFLILRPVGALRSAAISIATGDLSRRAPEAAPRELADLAKSFNFMADALAERTALERRARAELEAANERMQAANKELEAFSYSVSHDLRTPLRAVDGFSRILADEYAGKLDAEGQRLLAVVRDGTGKMNQLINDILAFSRIGRQEIAAGAVDIAAAVRAALDDLAPAVAGREIAFDVKPLPPAHGDAAMIRRVWANLLDNAVKFTKPKAAARVEIGATAGDKETVYYVKDNGVGFDMKYAGKLFGVFQRLHGPTEFPGTGIGLAIVNRIVARHGGRVWAEGKVGEGAAFFFALPTKENVNG